MSLGIFIMPRRNCFILCSRSVMSFCGTVEERKMWVGTATTTTDTKVRDFHQMRRDLFSTQWDESQMFSLIWRSHSRMICCALCILLSSRNYAWMAGIWKSSLPFLEIQLIPCRCRVHLGFILIYLLTGSPAIEFLSLVDNRNLISCCA